MSEFRAEVERRKLNVIEALILASLLSGVVALLSMREQMVSVNTTIAYQAEQIREMRGELVGFRDLQGRVTTLEVKVAATERALGTGGGR